MGTNIGGIYLIFFNTMSIVPLYYVTLLHYLLKLFIVPLYYVIILKM